MSEPLASTDSGLFVSSLRAIQESGTKSQTEQSELLRKYGSRVYDDVNVSGAGEGNAALIPLLQTIPGVVVGKQVKEFVNDGGHIIVSSYALRCDLAYIDDKHWIDVGITFPGFRPETEIGFERVSDNVGISVALKFGEKGKLVSGKIEKRDHSLSGRSGHQTKGSVAFDAEGAVSSSSGDMEKFSKGTINVAKLLTNVTTPEHLDKKIEFDGLVPITDQ